MGNSEQVYQQYFNKLDKFIIENHSDEIADMNVYSIDNLYTKCSWYMDMKKKSPILKTLVKNKMYFDSFKVSLDKVIITLCTFINYSNYVGNSKSNNTYIRVPDRLCVERNQTSREKTYNIIDMLCALHIIDVIKDNSGVQFKINQELIQSDEYILTKCKSFLKSDLKWIFNCEEKGTFYFYDYCENTILKQKREFVIGITLAYNELLLNKNKFFYNYRNNTKDKTAMLYVEIPVYLIARIWKVSEKQVMRYISKLFNHAIYIKKHDSVYSDKDLSNVKNIKNLTNNITSVHYISSRYKEYYLNKYHKMNDFEGNSYENGHPRVTPYSAIIFVDELLKTKVGKNIQKNYFYYEDLLLRHLRYNSLDRTLYKENINTIEQENLIHTNKECSIASDIIGNSINTKGSIIGIGNLKYTSKVSGTYIPRQHLWGDTTKRSVESLCKFIKNMQVHLLKCPMKDFNNQLQEVYKGIDAIANRKLYFIEQHYSNNNMCEGYFSTRLLKTDEVLKHYGIYTDVQTKFEKLVYNSDLFNNYCDKNCINTQELKQQALMDWIDMSLYKNKYSEPNYSEVYDNGSCITDNTINMQNEAFNYENLMFI